MDDLVAASSGVVEPGHTQFFHDDLGTVLYTGRNFQNALTINSWHHHLPAEGGQGKADWLTQMDDLSVTHELFVLLNMYNYVEITKRSSTSAFVSSTVQSQPRTVIDTST